MSVTKNVDTDMIALETVEEFKERNLMVGKGCLPPPRRRDIQSERGQAILPNHETSDLRVS